VSSDPPREYESLVRQLTDAEQRCASIPDLRDRIGELEAALAAVNARLDAAVSETRQLDQRLMSSERTLREMYASPSWRVTKPLRYLGRRVASA
jgi:predicted  nucleic acid-binding Zn-ribbon protein